MSCPMGDSTHTNVGELDAVVGRRFVHQQQHLRLCSSRLKRLGHANKTTRVIYGSELDTKALIIHSPKTARLLADVHLLGNCYIATQNDSALSSLTPRILLVARGWLGSMRKKRLVLSNLTTSCGLFATVIARSLRRLKSTVARSTDPVASCSAQMNAVAPFELLRRP
ncbi:hypothetical protein Plhal304r1_c024g0083111 [Plasmopara halstedii]